MKKNYLFNLLLFLFALSSVTAQITPNADNILYVNKNVIGGNGSGDSWTNAIKELRDAISWTDTNSSQWISSNVLKIWVAQGEYQPNSGQSFKLFNHVRIYGGFNATESELEERDWETNTTILKGNGNSVIRNIYTNEVKLTKSSVLDGFTITNGNATNGGGMYNVYASPTLNHLIIHNNTATNGGGIYNTFYSSPIATHVIIRNNTAERLGGGIYNLNNANPILTNVLIHHNTVSSTDPAHGYGGGLYAQNSRPVLVNVTITENKSHNDGKGIFFDISSINIYNSIIWGNTDLNGAEANNIVG